MAHNSTATSPATKRARYLAYRAEIAAKNGFDRGDADIFRPGEDATTRLLAT